MCRILTVFLVATASTFLPLPFANGQDFLKQLEQQLQKQRDEKSENRGSGSKSTPKPEQPRKNKTEPKTSPFSWDLFGGSASEGNKSQIENEENTAGAAAPSLLPNRAADNSSSSDNAAIKRESQTESESQPSGYLGLVAEQPTGGGLGLIVADIDRNSPAFLGGFKINDRLLAVNGYAIGNIDDFAQRLFETRIGVPVKFLVNRNGKNVELTAVLQNRDTARRLRKNSTPSATSGSVLLGANPIPDKSLGRPNFGVIAYDLGDAFRKQFGIRAFRGAAIAEVSPESPAAEAGLSAGDCVVSVNGTVIQGVDDLRLLVERSTVGDLLNVSFYRGQQLIETNLILTALEEDQSTLRPIYPNTSSNQRSDSRKTQLESLPQNSVQRNQTSSTGKTADNSDREYIRSLENELIEVRRELLQTQRQLAEMQRKVLELESRR